jgi:hypothetical protein
MTAFLLIVFYCRAFLGYIGRCGITIAAHCELLQCARCKGLGVLNGLLPLPAFLGNWLIKFALKKNGVNAIAKKINSKGSM